MDESQASDPFGWMRLSKRALVHYVVQSLARNVGCTGRDALANHRT